LPSKLSSAESTHQHGLSTSARSVSEGVSLRAPRSRRAASASPSVHHAGTVTVSAESHPKAIPLPLSSFSKRSFSRKLCPPNPSGAEQPTRPGSPLRPFLLDDFWSEVRAKGTGPGGLSPVRPPRSAPCFGTRRRHASRPSGPPCVRMTRSTLRAISSVAYATPSLPGGMLCASFVPKHRVAGYKT
jgi:hypothetical protein